MRGNLGEWPRSETRTMLREKTPPGTHRGPAGGLRTRAGLTVEREVR